MEGGKVPVILTMFVALFAAVAVVVHRAFALDGLSVGTTVGQVTGFINGSTPNVAQFLGIPFAEPPVGILRWEKPVVKSPEKNIDATHFSPSCPQWSSASHTVWNYDVPQFVISGPTGEDCLTLNIWAPATAGAFNTTKLPVIVWIYGGGFNTGGGQIEYQIPAQWVQRSQAHIVVGINYRVNIFGFPNARGQNQSTLNLGLLDQRLGLEWVRSNIAAFGGDPAKISLWGQSAGAMSVGYHQFAWYTDPIVHGYIMDSGTALLPDDNIDISQSNFTFVAKQLGCGGLNATAEFNCMKNVSSSDIEGYLKAYSDNGTSPSLSFLPVSDDITKFKNYTERALSGKISTAPSIIGTTDNEGIAFLAWGDTNQTEADLFALDEFMCPAEQTTYDRYAINATTYRYYYTGNFTNISPSSWEGAYHSSELPLIFGTHSNFRGESTPFEYAVSYRYQDLYLAFANDPVNSLAAQGWPAYEPGGSVLKIGDNGLVTQLMNVSILQELCVGLNSAPGVTLIPT